MKTELAIHGAIYVSVLSLAGFLWRWPVALALCLAAMSPLMLLRWHHRSELLFYATGCVLGPVGER